MHTFFSLKGSISKMSGQPQIARKYLSNLFLQQGLLSRLSKEPQSSMIKKIAQPNWK